MARLGELSVPVAWFLLPSKDTSTFKAALTHLKEEQDVDDPLVVHLDFELAEARALHDVFPTTRVVGCDFHWKQVNILIIFIFILSNLFLVRL